jgi:hypothetical protein
MFICYYAHEVSKLRDQREPVTLSEAKQITPNAVR